MKKLYILLFTILISGLSFGQVFITELADPNNDATARYIELYNAGTSAVDFTEGTGWRIDKYTNASATVSQTLALTGTIPAGGFYIIATGATSTVIFNTWGVTPDQWDGAVNDVAGSNGDDNLELYDGTNTLVDQFGVPGEDGNATLTCHEFEDGRAERKPGTTSGNPIWDEAEWNVWSDSASATCTSHITSPQDAPGIFDPGSWLGTNTDPTLTIFDGPANGSSVIDDPETATQATIDFTTTNFIMSNDAGGGVSDFSGDGYIVWSIENTVGSVFVDGGNIFTSNDGFEYTVTGLAIGETYFFTSELVDNTGASLSSPVVYSFTIAIASYTDVADLAALRASPVGPDFYYRVLGPVINTNTISATEQTMYFQDGTAGIMVYDPDFEVQSYNIGDAVSNIRGHLVLVSDVLQFIPTFADWGTPDTTGNSVGIPTVTIAALLTNWEDYESELVRVNGATFADAGGIFVNAIGGTGNYNITDATGTTIFRSAFSNADYIGQTIPSGNQDLVVIVAEFFGSVQVTSRGLSDITLDIKTNEIGGFNMFPNPTSLGYINIFSKNNAEMNVSVFDILGKQVINTVMTSEKLNVSALNTGVYIMKITQGKATSTKKLVIN